MRALTVDDRLDAIAGPPAGILTGPDQAALIGGFTAGGPATFYAAWRHFARSAGYYGIVSLQDGTESVNHVIVQSRPTNQLYESVVRSAGANVYLRVDVAASPVMVAAIWADPTTGDATLEYLSGETVSASATGVDVQPNMAINTRSARTGEFTPLVAAAYPAVHTEHQRKLIMAKLLKMSEEQ